MRNDELKQFSEALTAALEVYDKRTSAMTIEIWWEVLKRFDLPAVLNGFSLHLQNPDNGQFAPKPADIIRLIEGSNTDKAMQAWTRLDHAVRTVSPYHTVVFDDPLIHIAVQDMGGWIRLCNSDMDEYPFIRNEFVKRYQGLAIRPQESFPAKLIGIAEQANTESGQKVAPPMLIGNSQKAEQIFLSGGANNQNKVTAMLNIRRIA